MVSTIVGASPAGTSLCSGVAALSCAGSAPHPANASISAAALDRGTNLVISVSTCCSGRSCTEYRNLAVAAERRHFERVRTAVWHFHPRRPARHYRNRYSTNVARLVTEKSSDMQHRHMALDRLADRKNPRLHFSQ